MILTDSLDFLNSLFFSKRCSLCGIFNENNNLCFNCFSNLKYLTIACKKCQQPLNYISDEVILCQKCIDKNYNFFDEMICPFIYNVFLKKYIIMLKNQNAYYLSNFFCKFLYNKMKEKIDKNCIIAPIPLHDTRLFDRGYNQSLFLAQSFARIANIECINDLFIRTRNTCSQANKTISQRTKNVEGAFVCNIKYNNYLKSKKILIIDDVITTGATMFECAKTMISVDNKGIQLLAIGRRVFGNN